jgi:hypothetical protein
LIEQHPAHFKKSCAMTGFDNLVAVAMRRTASFCGPAQIFSSPCIYTPPLCRLADDRPLRRSGRRLRAAVDMCSPVQFIPALREAVACGFTMPVRYDGEICRWIF